MSHNVFTTKPGASDGLELGTPLGAGGSTNLSGGGHHSGSGFDNNTSSHAGGLNSGSGYDNTSSGIGSGVGSGVGSGIGSTNQSGDIYGNALDGTDTTGTSSRTGDVTGSRSTAGYDSGPSGDRNLADTSAGVQAGMGVGHHNQGQVRDSTSSGLTGGDNSDSTGYRSSAIGGAGAGAGFTGTGDSSSTPIADQYSSNTRTGPIGGEPVGSHSGLKEYNDQNLTTPGTGSGYQSTGATGLDSSTNNTGLNASNSQQHRGAGMGIAAIGAGAAAYGADRAYNDRDTTTTSTGGHRGLTGSSATTTGGQTGTGIGGLTGDGYGGQTVGQTGDNSVSSGTTGSQSGVGSTGLNRTGDQYSSGHNTTTAGDGGETALGAGAAGLGAGAIGAGSTGTGTTGGASRDGIATHGTHGEPSALKQELTENQGDDTNASHPESKGPHGLVWHDGKYVHQRELDLHGSTGVPLEKAFQHKGE